MKMKWSSLPVAFAIGLSLLAWSASGRAAALSALTGTAWRLVELLGKPVTPAAAALTSNIDATANTFAIALIRSFEKPILGGAHYTFAVALPYVWQDISASAPRASISTS